MSLIRWNPARTLSTMDYDINRFLDNFFNLEREPGRMAKKEWSPRVNVRELKDSFEVTADLPGMSKDEISVELENELLTIKGDTKKEKEEDKGNYHICERSHGKFERTFTLPDYVKADAIEAEYKNGVLKVNIPKTEAPRPKEVPIKVK